MFDGMSLEDFGTDNLDAYSLGDSLKYHAQDILSIDTDTSSLIYSYAMAFLSDVNWTEIASSLIETYKDEVSA
jgi:hypothetical protein